MPSKVWGEVTHAIVEVLQWISNFTPQLSGCIYLSLVSSAACQRWRSTIPVWKLNFLCTILFPTKMVISIQSVLERVMLFKEFVRDLWWVGLSDGSSLATWLTTCEWISNFYIYADVNTEVIINFKGLSPFLSNMFSYFEELFPSIFSPTHLHQIHQVRCPCMPFTTLCGPLHSLWLTVRHPNAPAARLRLFPAAFSIMMMSSNGTFSALLALCAGIHRSPVNSSHKGQRRGALMFSLICAGIHAWVNNREAGDLRRHRAHYDIIVMNEDI